MAVEHGSKAAALKVVSALNGEPIAADLAGVETAAEICSRIAATCAVQPSQVQLLSDGILLGNDVLVADIFGPITMVIQEEVLGPCVELKASSGEALPRLALYGKASPSGEQLQVGFYAEGYVRMWRCVPQRDGTAEVFEAEGRISGRGWKVKGTVHGEYCARIPRGSGPDVLKEDKAREEEVGIGRDFWQYAADKILFTPKDYRMLFAVGIPQKLMAAPEKPPRQGGPPAADRSAKSHLIKDFELPLVEGDANAVKYFIENSVDEEAACEFGHFGP